LFRWFVGLGIDDPVWDVTVFTKNREIAARFFAAILDNARVKGLLSDEHPGDRLVLSACRVVLVSGAAAAEPKQVADMAAHETIDRSLPAAGTHPTSLSDVRFDVTTRGRSTVR
jgi:hypothetical protein